MVAGRELEAALAGTKRCGRCSCAVNDRAVHDREGAVFAQLQLQAVGRADRVPLRHGVPCDDEPAIGRRTYGCVGDGATAAGAVVQIDNVQGDDVVQGGVGQIVHVRTWWTDRLRAEVAARIRELHPTVGVDAQLCIGRGAKAKSEADVDWLRQRVVAYRTGAAKCGVPGGQLGVAGRRDPVIRRRC